ncbi:MAG: type II toxin-antitoxin system VapC family toxin [Geminicoccaceae bacterium]
MTKLFVDTSAFYAIADGGDRHHRGALSALQARIGTDRVMTSDHVVVESWLLICSRLGRTAAMRFWDGVSIGVVTIVGITAEDFRRGREIAQEWSDQAFSIVDCTSFALIERLDVRRALAFDKHFRIVRFGWRRQRALEIVPH